MYERTFPRNRTDCFGNFKRKDKTPPRNNKDPRVEQIGSVQIVVSVEKRYYIFDSQAGQVEIPREEAIKIIAKELAKPAVKESVRFND